MELACHLVILNANLCNPFLCDTMVQVGTKRPQSSLRSNEAEVIDKSPRDRVRLGTQIFDNFLLELPDIEPKLPNNSEASRVILALSSFPSRISKAEVTMMLGRPPFPAT